MILYTINGSGSDSVKALAKHLNLDIELRPRSEFKEALLKVNPRATVPTLVEGDTVLTETAALLRLVAKRHSPQLLGDNPVQEAKVDELISFLSTSVYHGYLQKFRPEHYITDTLQFGAVQQKAMAVISKNLQVWEDMMRDATFLLTEQLTIVDFYAYVLLKWQSGIESLSQQAQPALWQYWQKLQHLPAFR